MTDENVSMSVGKALGDVNANIVKFNSIEKTLRQNSILIANLVCELSEIHEDLKRDNLDRMLPLIEKTNHQIEVLATARIYMNRFEKIAESNSD